MTKIISKIFFGLVIVYVVCIYAYTIFLLNN
jgi:CHASE3 domain sensor protein